MQDVGYTSHDVIAAFLVAGAAAAVWRCRPRGFYSPNRLGGAMLPLIVPPSAVIIYVERRFMNEMTKLWKVTSRTCIIF